MSATFIEVFNAIVLTLTLGAIIWYTEINRRLLNNAKRQTDELIHQGTVSLLPSLFAEIKSNPHGQDEFVLTNVGNGVAVNITMSSVMPEGTPAHEYKFKSIGMLRPSESTVVVFDEFLVNRNKGHDEKNL